MITSFGVLKQMNCARFSFPSCTVHHSFTTSVQRDGMAAGREDVENFKNFFTQWHKKLQNAPPTDTVFQFRHNMLKQSLVFSSDQNIAEVSLTSQEEMDRGRLWVIILTAFINLEFYIDFHQLITDFRVPITIVYSVIGNTLRAEKCQSFMNTMLNCLGPHKETQDEMLWIKRVRIFALLNHIPFLSEQDDRKKDDLLRKELILNRTQIASDEHPFQALLKAVFIPLSPVQVSLFLQELFTKSCFSPMEKLYTILYIFRRNDPSDPSHMLQIIQQWFSLYKQWLEDNSPSNNCDVNRKVQRALLHLVTVLSCYPDNNLEQFELAMQIAAEMLVHHGLRLLTGKKTVQQSIKWHRELFTSFRSLISRALSYECTLPLALQLYQPYMNNLVLKSSRKYFEDIHVLNLYLKACLSPQFHAWIQASRRINIEQQAIHLASNVQIKVIELSQLNSFFKSESTFLPFIRWYAKRGEMQLAEQQFNLMINQLSSGQIISAAPYETMIQGYCDLSRASNTNDTIAVNKRNGSNDLSNIPIYIQHSIRWMEQYMINKAKIFPTETVICSLMSALIRANLPIEALQVYEFMKSHYQIKVTWPVEILVMQATSMLPKGVPTPASWEIDLTESNS